MGSKSLLLSVTIRCIFEISHGGIREGDEREAFTRKGNWKYITASEKFSEMSGPLNNRALRKLLLSYPAKAIKILCDQYYNSLMRIAFKLTGDDEASKDIVQDTFVYLWLHAREIGNYHERSIQHYLVRIVRNKSITYYKERILLSKRKIWLMDSLSWREEPIDSRIIQMEITQDILDAIARFPEREHQCLIMKIEEDLSNHEIAARLNVGIKAVERSLTSARKRLRRYLQRT